jgi:hypothetical protein
MLEAIMDSETIADALLGNLKGVFGSSVFSALSTKMTKDYLGDEMDIRTALINRPDLFERIFIGILGTAGERILAWTWDKLSGELALDKDIQYAKKGDLARCMAMISN